jgi:carbon-monoxide dehydrogenase large subunit
MTKFGVGQAVKRLEDNTLVRGMATYTDDLQVEDALHAFVLRSPFAHATIDGIDTSDAAAAPGVHAVLTGDDVAADGLGPIPCAIPLQNADGSDRADTPRPILAQGRVRHVGDPVALIVADTLAQARDAAEMVAVDYEELPAVVDPAAAAQPGAPLVWDDIANNTAFEWVNPGNNREATEKAFAQAAHVTKLRVINNRVVVNSMEPRACVATYDEAEDKSYLYTPTQGPHVIRGQLADAILKLDDKVAVRTGQVGGGFGMKVFVHPEQPLTVWASRRLKRTVRWTSDRSEAFMSDVQGRDHVHDCEIAMDADGRFTALRLKTWSAMGGYLSNFIPMVATNGTDMMCGLYKTPAFDITVYGVMTNTVPVDAYRGAGRPEAAYLLERMVDACARDIGLGPDEIRRRNFIQPADMPYDAPLPVVYDSGDFPAVMEETMRQADWAGFEARRAEAAQRGKYRGIGMACYIERCGGGAPETAVAKFDDDGVTIYIGTMENGTGLTTSYTQILSGALGIDAERITIRQGDTDLCPPGLTGGSRSVPVGGAAVLGVADNIRRKGLEIAAHMLEVAPADVEYEDGEYRVAGTDRTMSLWEVARAAQDAANLPDGMEPGLDDEYVRTPEAPTFPNGCHIVEVEIDPDTGAIDVERYTVVDDFGEVINPIMLEGQVHGGIVQGLGQAIHEHTVYDEETGQLMSGSLMDYDLPKADRFPMFSFDTLNVRCTTNPLGIKGSGEAGAIGAPPAVINAIVDAIHGATGITHVDMPATPHLLWQAINGARRAA